MSLSESRSPRRPWIPTLSICSADYRCEQAGPVSFSAPIKQAAERVTVQGTNGQDAHLRPPTTGCRVRPAPEDGCGAREARRQPGRRSRVPGNLPVPVAGATGGILTCQSLKSLRVRRNSKLIAAGPFVARSIGWFGMLSPDVWAEGIDVGQAGVIDSVPNDHK